MCVFACTALGCLKLHAHTKCVQPQPPPHFSFFPPLLYGRAQGGQAEGQPGRQGGNGSRDGHAVAGGSLDLPSDQLVLGTDPAGVGGGWRAEALESRMESGLVRAAGRRTDVSLPSMLIF